MPEEFSVIKHLKRYVLDSRKSRIFVFISVLLAFLSELSNLKSFKYYSKLTDQSYEDHQYWHFLAVYCFFGLFEILSQFSLTYLRELVDCNTFASSFAYLYTRFIDYPYSDFVNIICGDLFFSIMRVSKSLGIFIKGVIFMLPYYAIFLGIAFYRVSKDLDWNILFVLALSILSYFVTICCLQHLRSYSLVKMNAAFDRTELKVNDVFYNYELIHICDSMEREIDSYYDIFEEYVYWSRIHWLFNDVIDMVKATFFLLIQIFFIGNLLSAKNTKLDIKSLSDIFNDTKRCIDAAIEQIEELISNVPCIINTNISKLSSSEKKAGMAGQIFTSQIQIRNLQCSHRDYLIFSGINLEFKKGEKIAITGPNGSGKSTFIKCLLQLNNYRGEILIDGISTKDIDNEHLRNMISYIPQDSLLFDASIIDNLKHLNSKISDDAVISDCIKYNIHTEFKSLGYDFFVDGHGSSLSAMQKQKISFMRSIIKDSPILIIDELTAEMGKSFEKQIIEAIFSKLMDKTVIMIIHNLDYLNLFDRVIFFDEKSARIVDSANFKI
jgi:ABC-type multidrug transport system fused ATPase/permease subunit